MEDQAKILYTAVTLALPEIGFAKLLTAAGDARSCVSWNAARPETRDVFLRLAAKLTETASKI